MGKPDIITTLLALRPLKGIILMELRKALLKI